MPKLIGEARPSPAYPRREQVLRAIEAVRETGFKVSTVDICRDGTIRLMDNSSAPAATMFDVWEKANKL